MTFELRRTGERFEIRHVDAERRVYVRISDDRRYHDACIQADHARALFPGEHFVVWDRDEQRAIYDSRTFGSDGIAAVRADGGAPRDATLARATPDQVLFAPRSSPPSDRDAEHQHHDDDEDHDELGGPDRSHAVHPEGGVITT